MYTVKQCRETLEDLVGGYNLMLEAGATGYKHRETSGSARCTIGYIRLASPLMRKYKWQLHDSLYFSRTIACYLFWFGIARCHGPVVAKKMKHLRHNSKYETALARMRRIIGYVRRRLAILEVEEGKRWHEIKSIGQARDEYLEEVLA